MARFAFLSLFFCLLAYEVVGNSLGGWEKVPVHSKDAQNVANIALKEVNDRGNSMFRSVLVEITQVKRQLVAGYQYKIDFNVGHTGCMKNEKVPDLKSCIVREVQHCTATVWIKEWDNYEKVKELKCGEYTAFQNDKNEKLKEKDLEDKGIHSVLMPGPVMPGAPIKGKNTDQDVQDAAKYFLNYLNARSNAMFRLGMTRIKSVTKQIVAGTKYTIVMEVGPTQCRNTGENSNIELSRCPVNAVDQLKDCTVVLWDRPWVKRRYEVLDSSCDTQTPPNPNLDTTMNQKPHLIGGNDHMTGRIFQEFKRNFTKVYKDKKEEKKRFFIFKDNLRRIRKLQETELGSGQYGITQFTDLTYDEFKNHLGFKPGLAKSKAPWPMADIPNEAPPTSFDWRDHKAVTPVKNQGSCGSCWAFSTTGNVEGQWAIKKGQLLSLSEQELVDCDKLDQGCNGGLPSLAYKSIMKLGGLETEKQYPYEGEDEHCSFKKKSAKVDINGAVNISTNEADMASWLAKNGPISIGINAFAMQFYFGGISHPWKIFCNPAELDHGVLIVGYGVKGSEPYWIIKNSWGPSWGEQGYYLVYRGSGVCGLNRMPTSSVVN